MNAHADPLVQRLNTAGLRVDRATLHTRDRVWTHGKVITLATFKAQTNEKEVKR